MSQLGQLVLATEDVRRVRGRLLKVARLAEAIRGLDDAELAIGVAWLSGVLPQGRIGVGPALLRQVAPPEGAAEATVAVLEVDATFTAIKAVSGGGSGARREAFLRDLLTRCTRGEQEFLVRLLVGELRQGANEGLVAEAIASASGVAPAAVRRAWMLSGDLAGTAVRARLGADALAEVALEVFRPVGPMLAETAADPSAAVERLGRAMLDVKLDGARVQVHRRGDVVRVFTRGMLEVTGSVPEVVEAVLSLPVEEIVLDGEAIALRKDGSPLPFQVTMRRFGRKQDVHAARSDLPLSAVFFDVLWVDGRPVLDLPLSERDAVLRSVVPERLLVERITTADGETAEAFFDAAVARGHEGIMAKSLESAYEAGNRGDCWLKVKPAHTLDLVVLAVEQGSGRRSEWLSNLHLGARDPDSGGFAMVGKTFKGLTDATLAWQTAELGARAIRRDEWVVHVRPELVVEIAFNDVQVSPRYESGVALRFARVKRYRADKTPAEADTIETVRALLPK
jgi:DNA ligase-1